jgi:hypothetical protein
MSLSMKSIVRLSLVAAAMLVAAACSPHKIPAVTVADLMEDRVTLDGILIKCNQKPSSAQTNADCVNARIAAERLDSQKQQQHSADDEAKRVEAFERSREQLRQQQDKQRQEQEAKVKVDAYHLPVVPVDQPPPPKDPQSPIVGQTTTP